MRHLKKKIAAAEVKHQLLTQTLLEGEESISDDEKISPEQQPTSKVQQPASIVSPLVKQEATETTVKQTKRNATAKKKIEEDPLSDSSSDEPSYRTKKGNAKGSPDSKMTKGATSAKNIIKNYGRALQNFAISNMAIPYINPLLAEEKTTLKDFRRFFYSKKKQVRSIAGLRNLLLVSDGDDKETASFKKVFQTLSIIFIKYFSVNWIFSGKLLNKIAHLKCRFKMLRRVKNPENFTYLKGFL